VADDAGAGKAAATVRLTLDLPLAMLERPIYAQWILCCSRGGGATRALELTLRQ
jgi:hypothetical protein